MAARLHEEGVPVVGVPKTIDNDLGGTELTFGFQTAVQIATDAIDRLHTTAESHDRVMVVEVMGAQAGWIATYAGIAGGADAILVPERPFDIDEVSQRCCGRRHARGASFSIVVVAEGATPKGRGERVRHADRRVRPRAPGGIGVVLEREIEEPHRLRDAGHDPRPRPAGRHADGVRPRARDPLRGGAARPRRPAGVPGRWWRWRGTQIVEVPLREALAGAEAARPGAV